MFERSAAIIATLLLCAPSALAGTQLFSGSWHVKAFGNERTGGTGASSVYSAVALPLGQQCNPLQPRCPFQSTPTDGKGRFAPLGGSQAYGLYCAPWYNFGGNGTTARPPKGKTATTGGRNQRRMPPLYRNPAFFSPGGAPNRTFCTATSTGYTPGGKGKVQAGHPATGHSVPATRTAAGGFHFATAKSSGSSGIRATGVAGERGVLSPYVYDYVYATVRNAAGDFGPGKGPGSFNIPYLAGKLKVASIRVKQGPAKFGGTMRMLGALTSKVCYYRAGGCSLGELNWLYDAVGTTGGHTMTGVVTKGYQVLTSEFYWNSGLGAPSTVMLVGSRFGWTTGSVTVTAVGRGPNKTVHYAKGYDNRTPTSGRGTIQLVSPLLTHWLQPAVKFETGGIGILKLKFVPEPDAWLTLAAGIALLGAGYWRRAR